MLIFYIGAFFVSLSTLLLEVSLARIFSVTMWYHFAFMIVSIALFGFGASGAFLTIFRGILKKDKNKVAMFLTSILSIVIILSMLIISRVPLDLFQISDNPLNLFKMFLYYLILAIPFFMSGLYSVYLFSIFPEKTGKIYFLNLVGSGIGCIAVVFIIPLFSNAGAIICASIFVLCAALLFSLNISRKITLLLLGMLVSLFILLVNPNILFDFRIANSKGLSHQLYQLKRKPVLTRWNVFSRLDVIEADNEFYSPGLSPKYNSSFLPRQAFIYIDADAIATITQVEQGEEKLKFFKYIPSSVAYQFKEYPTVCIIGAGGGFDVLTALSVAEPKHVTAVEVNPDISRIVTVDFGQFSGFIYNLPNVSIINAEGRSFIRNCSSSFDIIQLTLVDTWAAASSGAYTLAENYLYTKEAFIDYINHLSPDGVLTITRWNIKPYKENLRIVTLAFSALEQLGVQNPKQNVVLIGSESVATLLLKKTAFKREDIETIKNICEKSGFNILYAPYVMGSNIFYSFLNSKNKNLFYKEYPFNVEPPTDDKPFYFHYSSWKKFNINNIWQLASVDRNSVSYLVLLLLFAQALVLSGIFIIGPLAFFKRDNSVKITSRWYFLVYFSCLGLGFMFVEVALIQKFILFLGHPVYSLSVVLSSLLIYSGLGSLFTTVIKENYINKLNIMLGILVVMLFTYTFLLDKLSYMFLGSHLFIRFAVTIVLLAPLGFLMGMPFPLGLRLVNAVDPKLIPWVFGVNGCFSVMGSILSVLIAMDFGFSTVFKLASIIYLMSIIVIQREYYHCNKNTL